MSRFAQPSVIRQIMSKLTNAVGTGTAEIAWVGKKSGKPFHTTVWYSRHGNGVRIRVGKAAGKTWWRNFRGDGWPITVTINGKTRNGYGNAQGEPPGKVMVHVTWTES